ncbi:MAG: hypothetical protein IJ113_01080 [Eggerthellaceae bacterium]|nr:hypothetical protein [Eggerthellaceae bacterium]
MMYYQEHRLDFYSTSDTSQPIYTTYQSDTVLETLEEAPPSVKTHYIEVPASDGVIDLTDAVAGRPLYGQRTVDAVVHFVGADHSAAVVWAQQLRDSIHGQRLQVSTPDSRVFDGYYIGRVTVEHEIDQEHVKASIHADCDPWLYYGKIRITMPAGSNTVVDAMSAIPTAMRSRYVNSTVELKHMWLISANYFEYAYRNIALVESTTDNIVQMPEQLMFARYDIGAADFGDDTKDYTFGMLDTTSNAITQELTSDSDTRIMAIVPKDSNVNTDSMTVSTGAMNITHRRSVYFGVRVSGTVTGTDDTYGTPQIQIMHFSGRAQTIAAGHASKIDHYGGGVPVDSTAMTVNTSVPIDENGEFDTFIVMNALEIRGGGTPSWIYAGVESTFCTGTITVEIFLGYVKAESYIAPSNTTRTIALPTGMYATSDASVYDRITLARAESTLYTYFEETGTSAVQKSSQDVHQLPLVAPRGTPKWVNACALNFYAEFIPASVIFVQQLSLTVDAGEMPTTMNIETSDPLSVTLDGKTYYITSSGYAPFAFTGEKTLQYTISGDSTAYLEYEKGRI